MKVEIEGVTLHLAHPDELPVRWVGQEELMRQFAAARGEEVAPPEAGFMSRLRSAFK